MAPHFSPSANVESTLQKIARGVNHTEGHIAPSSHDPSQL